MIEINLIPEQLKKNRKRNSFLIAGFNIPPEIIYGCGGALVFLLILVHVVFLLINLSRLSEYQIFKNEWKQMQPAKQNVDTVLVQLRSLQSKLKSIEDMTPAKQLMWSQKLNIISDSLPKGVWFKKIAVTEDMLFMEGSAISRGGQEMSDVHGLVSNLKANEFFMDKLSNLDIESIQSRKAGKVDISDFLITAERKKE